MLLSSAWAILLTKLTGSSSLQIGLPVAGRQHATCFDLIGLFVNTVVLKVELQSEMTIIELFSHVSEKSTSAFANQDAPLEQIIERLNPPRSSYQHPVFQTLLALHNKYEAAQIPALEMNELIRTNGHSEFDLVLTAEQTEHGLDCHIEFLNELYHSSDVAKWSEYFLNILKAFVTQPNATIAELSLMSNDDKRRLLGRPQSVLQATPTLLMPQRLSNNAVRFPDNIAIVDNGKEYTYAWLESHSNQLANYLLQEGITTEDRVAICLPRSAMFMVAIFAVMKAGATYVPLDRAQPKARSLYVLADSNQSFCYYLRVMTMRVTNKQNPIM